jgi:pyruvate/2-oxoglutarate dehydrogenase complex dihydrolipoamide acyltransferase (E2) component
VTKTPSQNRLAGLIATKGEAARPAEPEQRQPAATPAPQPTPAPSSFPAASSRSLGVKSLTLRLRDDEYERLREYAFRHRLTHQDILSEALRQYLSKEGSQ